jgi:hypothetical protein
MRVEAKDVALPVAGLERGEKALRWPDVGRVRLRRNSEGDLGRLLEGHPHLKGPVSGHRRGPDRGAVGVQRVSIEAEFAFTLLRFLEIDRSLDQEAFIALDF